MNFGSGDYAHDAMPLAQLGIIGSVRVCPVFISILFTFWTFLLIYIGYICPEK